MQAGSWCQGREMMISDLLMYDHSPLNPALKILVFLIFLAAVVVYLDTRRQFGGRIQKTVNLLLFFSAFMALGSLLRYFGTGTEFGFTEDYSLKWFQSLAYLGGIICLVLAGRRLLTLFRSDTHE